MTAPLIVSLRQRLPALLVWCLALITAMPILVLALSWFGNEGDVWRHLSETVLTRLVGNTLLLIGGVTVGVLVLGVSLAWMVSTCEFPGRRFFDWALFLPLAVPTYVLAFVSVDLLDFAGPLQRLLRDLLPGYHGINVRRPWLVILTLSLVLYPYVYMLARTAFMAQGQTLMEQARILGLSQRQAFWRVALPMARPAIAAGVALALMETLADFGAVSIFNFDTFTTAIYKSWYGLFNLNAAAQLASVLLVFVLVVLGLERARRGSARYAPGTARVMHRRQLPRGQALLLTLFATLVFLAAFGIPVARLLYWVALRGSQDLDGRYVGLISRTLLLGAMAALVTVTLAVLIGAVRRGAPRQRSLALAARLATLGYAMPGSVLAVGIVLSFAAVDRLLVQKLGWPALLMGGLLALQMAYVVRFLAVAWSTVETGFERVRPSLTDAARSLGATPRQVLWRVYLPLLAPGLLTAFLLVLIDVMKEMPATLLLRPFGWDTLAVRIHEMTAEGEWARAALPSLTLVLAGLLPVYLLMRRTRVS